MAIHPTQNRQSLLEPPTIKRTLLEPSHTSTKDSITSSPCFEETLLTTGVMNRLDPIEELYNMYSEEEDTLRIVEIEDNGLDLVLDVEGPADPYMDL